LNMVVMVTSPVCSKCQGVDIAKKTNVKTTF
jgi:hypothetical protein